MQPLAFLGLALRALARGALALLAPNSCRQCGAPLERGGPLCDECAADVRWIGAACPRCATPRPAGEDERPGGGAPEACPECTGRPLPFRRAIAAGVYAGPLRRLVLAHKFEEDRAARRFLVAALRDACRRRGFHFSCLSGYSVLTSVPLHPLKRIWRGRDPAREIAEDLAHLLRRTYRPLLRKIRWTPAQAALSREQRRRNLRGAFRARRRSLPRRVVLVDDVLTTATTASECAAALRAAGVQEVIVLAVARS
ncbi:MAG: ComF family protein [Planctomycetes bacterium]|nr:ComF family protein [Planctomycetota bacterium]